MQGNVNYNFDSASIDTVIFNTLLLNLEYNKIEYLPYYVHMSSREIFDFFTKLIDNCKIKVTNTFRSVYYFYNDSILIRVSGGGPAPDNDVEQTNIWLDVILYGTNIEDYVIKIKEYLDTKKIFKVQTVDLNWWFFRGNNLDYKTINIGKENINTKLFEPILGMDPEKFADDYWNSPQNILILNGEPGTGKSTFIKYLLFHTKSNACLTYDPEVASQNSFYVDFLKSNDSFLILEDAETLLLRRVEERNQAMSILLNVSNGLVDSFLSKKKIIFTANLKNLNQIDDALLRPGRCFKIVNFRSLTKDEIKNLDIEVDMTRNEISAAEIFYGKNNNQKQKIGF